MNNGIELSGMVLSAAPQGEYDKRLVLLTRERGRITAFARGARRINSSLLAATSPFTFGTFRLYEGKNAYTLVAADVKNYFEKLKTDFSSAWYGFYFMEFADYYARENLEAKDMLNLLYLSLLALEKKQMKKKLIRYAFEVRLMVQNGEFPQSVSEDPNLMPASRAAFRHMISVPLSRLFAFDLTEPVLSELCSCQDRIRQKYIDKSFRSLEILENTDQQ